MSQFCSPRTYGLLRKTLESNQIPEGTSRLAGGPYRHQGLSSIECGTPAVVGAPTQVIPLFVLMEGLEPSTSTLSG